jgi:hypothetical protein
MSKKIRSIKCQMCLNHYSPYGTAKEMKEMLESIPEAKNYGILAICYSCLKTNKSWGHMEK